MLNKSFTDNPPHCSGVVENLKLSEWDLHLLVGKDGCVFIFSNGSISSNKRKYFQIGERQGKYKGNYKGNG